ncbi:MAG: uncharacterized membrane protein YqaE (UPF0057 family) [Bradymonadia bacterium]|jgi:uncharacterized membrane protein YqaE (UPF0057 family)
MNILRVVLGLFVPPVAVFLTVGFGMHFWLNILLTMFGGLPGVIHAFWVMLDKGDIKL